MIQRIAVLAAAACIAFSAFYVAAAVDVVVDDSVPAVQAEQAAGNRKAETGETVRKIIDVSFWQDDIDWKQVKESGIDAAMLRVGYRDSATGAVLEDSKFQTYIQDARDAGVKVGVYFFSQATTEQEAKEEAEFVLKMVRSYRLELPVTIDYEYDEGGRLEAANLSADQQTAICDTFCKRVEQSGYTACIYANNDMLTNHLHAQQLSDQYVIWMAQYAGETTYDGEYTFWQYSESGTVPGIQTNTVDCNYWYDDGTQYNTKANLNTEPKQVTSLTVQRTEDETADLEWNAVDDVSGYEVYFSTSGADNTFHRVKITENSSQTSASVSGITDDELSHNQTIYFKVRAFSDKDGEKFYGGFSRTEKIKV